MKQEDILKDKFGTDAGMRVPEGYFSELERNIMNSLPPYESAPKPVKLSAWQRVKPYVYLAAMFCGIWLMMKVFHTATQPISMNLENPPEALVELLDGDMDFDFNYIPYSADFDIDDVDFIMSYDNIEDFEKDFENTSKSYVN